MIVGAPARVLGHVHVFDERRAQKKIVKVDHISPLSMNRVNCSTDADVQADLTLV